MNALTNSKPSAFFLAIIIALLKRNTCLNALAPHIRNLSCKQIFQLLNSLHLQLLLDETAQMLRENTTATVQKINSVISTDIESHINS